MCVEAGTFVANTLLSSISPKRSFLGTIALWERLRCSATAAAEQRKKEQENSQDTVEKVGTLCFIWPLQVLFCFALRRSLPKRSPSKAGTLRRQPYLRRAGSVDTSCCFSRLGLRNEKRSRDSERMRGKKETYHRRRCCCVWKCRRSDKISALRPAVVMPGGSAMRS